MARRHFPLLFFAALGVLPPISAPAASLCDDFAGQLRQMPDLKAGRVTLSAALTKGDHPLVEIAKRMDGTSLNDDSDKIAIQDIFKSRFHAGPVLRKAVGSFLEDSYAEISSLPNDDVHALVTSGGSAHCENFLFFDGAKGTRLPDAPKPAWAKGEGAMYLCYNDRGDMARLQGQIAFVETVGDLFSFNESLSITPLQDRHWGARCTLQANFHPRYRTDKVFIAPGSAINRDELAALASQIALARALAADPGNSADTRGAFHFGPPVPDSDMITVDRMRTAANAIKDYSELPQFGASDRDTATYDMPSYANAYPLVLGKRTYLMRIGHKVIGWRDFADYYLVLYSWDGGGLKPEASAVVKLEQGPLTSLRAKPG